MKYTVTKFFSKRSEGLKPYKIGSTIELTTEEAKPLIENGYIKQVAKPKKKKDESKSE